MKYLAEDILQAISGLHYAYLSSAALQTHEKVFTLVDDVHHGQFYHLCALLLSSECLLQRYESYYLRQATIFLLF